MMKRNEKREVKDTKGYIESEETLMNWNDAKAACKAKGMQLATYRSKTELDNFNNGDYHWIGSSWDPSLQMFEWVDGSLWSINDAIFTYKRASEPNQMEGYGGSSPPYQNCIFYQSTLIASQDCDNDYKSLCENVISCTSPPSVNNAATDITVVKSPGEIITYTCDFGYELSGGQTSWTRQCGIDGNWTTDSNVCVVKQCKTPPAVSNSNHNTLAVKNPGETITYTCASGYYLSNGQTFWTRFCEWGGTWEMDTNSCSVPIVTDDATTMSITTDQSVAGCACNIAEVTNTSSYIQTFSTFKVQVNKTSAYRRSLISAPDDRMSSAVIGYMGVFILCLVLAVPLLVDILNIFNDE
ncbi:unnamed protein product [Mytilus coruscus]|uniref:MRC n=1 Tax=Mytilus coruscus TaxID=42192 RepID=A0A6J8AFB0_MYTCO|nr:unnamed protein product [Mytilus coruscus]